MPQLHLSLSVVVATLVAILLSFTRVANASTAALGNAARLDAGRAAAGARGRYRTRSKTCGPRPESGHWTDFIVVLVTSFALLGPGMPSHRSSAPLPNNSKPIPPLAVVSMLGILGGLLALVAGIALCVSLSACSTAQLDADLHKVEVCAEDHARRCVCGRRW